MLRRSLWLVLFLVAARPARADDAPAAATTAGVALLSAGALALTASTGLLLYSSMHLTMKEDQYGPEDRGLFYTGAGGFFVGAALAGVGTGLFTDALRNARPSAGRRIAGITLVTLGALGAAFAVGATLVAADAQSIYTSGYRDRQWEWALRGWAAASAGWALASFGIPLLAPGRATPTLSLSPSQISLTAHF
jgi:hypothetical protein